MLMTMNQFNSKEQSEYRHTSPCMQEIVKINRETEGERPPSTHVMMHIPIQEPNKTERNKSIIASKKARTPPPTPASSVGSTDTFRGWFDVNLYSITLFCLFGVVFGCGLLIEFDQC
eukprot:341548_1